jgi:hypothetical protein
MSGSNCRLTRKAVNMKRFLRQHAAKAKRAQERAESLNRFFELAARPMRIQPTPRRSWLSRLTFGVLG